MKVKFNEILVGEVFISNNKNYVKVDELGAEDEKRNRLEFAPEEEVLESPVY